MSALAVVGHGPVDPGAVDLVNAALLGTDRRPLPDVPGPDATGWLLDRAAHERAARLLAGASMRLAVPAAAPPEDRPKPTAEARAVLDELLLQGSDAAIDLWLAELLEAGFALAPEHWTPLLDRSRRSTGIDRRRLAVALGPRGLWFARQNPAWSLVVRAAAKEAL